MTPEPEIERLKELVKRTGEFIAYFEIAEGKMLEWQHHIDHSLINQKQLFEQQTATLNKAHTELSDILTQAGAARWRLAAEQNLTAGQQHLASLEQLSGQVLAQITRQNEQFQINNNQLLEKIESLCETTVTQIEQAALSCNLAHFKQASDVSAEKIESTAKKALSKGERLLKSFQFKVATVAIIASSITALTIGLYMSDEMPWEIHKHAMHERHAGKALLFAWPKLTQLERDKIVVYNQHNDLK